MVLYTWAYDTTVSYAYRLFDLLPLPPDENTTLCNSNITCSELLSNVVPAVCSNNFIGSIIDQRERLRETAAQAAEATSAAAYWQLAAGTLVVGSVIINHGRFIAWIGLTVTLLSMQLLYVGWQMIMIALTMLMYTVLTYFSIVFYIFESVQRWAASGGIRKRWRLRHRLRHATSYKEYAEAGRELDELDGKAAWRANPGEGASYQAAGVAAACRQLRNARTNGDAEALVSSLRTMMQRKHLGVDHGSLFSECRIGTKEDVEEYVQEQVAALRWLRGAPEDGDACGVEDAAAKEQRKAAEAAAEAEAQAAHPLAAAVAAAEADSSALTTHVPRPPQLPLDECVELFERSSVCLGHTALCLSGGGALSMYHMGVVKALLENNAMPLVVSGTSGGAIVAGVIAMFTDEELLHDIIQDDIAVRYPERWFPPLEQQLFDFLKTGVLVQHDDFANCCKAYYGDTTFQEAYERTGRVANINISERATGVNSMRGALLLNHLTSPHVLIRSAVHASCCLPTVMLPTTLLAKTSSGEIVPFEKDEAEFIDGSFTADIPRQRLAELFHVTQNIVSQVNPHIVATMNSNRSNAYSWFRRGQAVLSAEVLHRLRIIAKLRLLPAMFGRDITAAMTQRYTGDVTIVPRIGGPLALLRTVQNPEPSMMHMYIHEGRIAAYAQLSHVRHVLSLEQELHQGLSKLLAARQQQQQMVVVEQPHAGQLPIRSRSLQSMHQNNNSSSPLPIHANGANNGSSSGGNGMRGHRRSQSGEMLPSLVLQPLFAPPPAAAPPQILVPPEATQAASAPEYTTTTAVTPAAPSPSSPTRGGNTPSAAESDSYLSPSGGYLSPVSPNASLDNKNGNYSAAGWASDGGEVNGGGPRGTLGPRSLSVGDEETPGRSRGHANGNGDANDRSSRSALLSRSNKQTKALQQLAREKEALHAALGETAEALRLSETRRRASHKRVRALEKALRLVHESTSQALGGGGGGETKRSSKEEEGDAEAEESDEHEAASASEALLGSPALYMSSSGEPEAAAQ